MSWGEAQRHRHRAGMGSPGCSLEILALSCIKGALRPGPLLLDGLCPLCLTVPGRKAEMVQDLRAEKFMSCRVCVTHCCLHLGAGGLGSFCGPLPTPAPQGNGKSEEDNTKTNSLAIASPGDNSLNELPSIHHEPCFRAGIITPH